MKGNVSAGYILKGSSRPGTSTLKSLAEMMSNEQQKSPDMVFMNGGAWDVQFDLVGLLDPGADRKVRAEDKCFPFLWRLLLCSEKNMLRTRNTLR